MAIVDKSPRSNAADANRRRMIEAAREAFVENGYAATTIKAIALRSGLSQESLYKTFGGKAGLLKAATTPRSPVTTNPFPWPCETTPSQSATPSRQTKLAARGQTWPSLLATASGRS